MDSGYNDVKSWIRADSFSVSFPPKIPMSTRVNYRVLRTSIPRCVYLLWITSPSCFKKQVYIGIDTQIFSAQEGAKTGGRQRGETQGKAAFIYLAFLDNRR